MSPPSINPQSPSDSQNPFSQIPNPNFPYMLPRECPTPGCPDSGSSKSLDSSSTNQGNFNYSCGSKMGFEKANHSGRSRPRLRLMKMRKQSGFDSGKSGKPESDKAGVVRNPFASVSQTSELIDEASTATASNSYVKTDNSCNNSGFVYRGNLNFVFGANLGSSTLNSSPENAGFVFSGNERSSELNCAAGIQGSVSGASGSSSVSYSNMEDGFVVPGANKGVFKSGSGSDDAGSLFKGDKSSFKPKPNLDNGCFVFGGAKESIVDTKAGAFSFGATEFRAGSNSKEVKFGGYWTQPGRYEFNNFENVTFVFGANKGVAVNNGGTNGTSGRSDEDAIKNGMESVFSLNKSTLNAKSESGENGQAVKVDSNFGFTNVGFVFGANQGNCSANSNLQRKSSQELGKSFPGLRGVRTSSSREDSGKVDHATCVSGADQKNNVKSDTQNNSRFNGESKKYSSSENVGQSNDGNIYRTGSIRDEFQKDRTNKTFIFGDDSSKAYFSSDNSKRHSNEVNNMNRGNSNKCNSFVNSETNNGNKFACSGANSLGSDTYKFSVNGISAGVNSLHIDDSRRANSNEERDCLNRNSSSSTNMFVFGSNQGTFVFPTEGAGTIYSDLLKSMHVQDRGKEDEAAKVDGINMRPGVGKTFASEINEKGDSFKGNVEEISEETYAMNAAAGAGNPAEQIKSHGFTGNIGKENQPHNLKKEANGSVNEDLLNRDFELKQPSSSPKGSGFQPNDENSEMPSIDGLGKEDFTFISTPLTTRKSFIDFDTSNANIPSFPTGFFPEFSKKSEFNTNSRPVRGKNLKKTKGRIRQRMPAERLTKNNYNSEEGRSQQHQESPGGGSPMDFSPYECSDCAPSVIHESTSIRLQQGSLTDAKERTEANGTNKKCQEPNENRSGDQFDSQSNLMSSNYSGAKDGSSAIRRRYRKKYKLRVGDGSNPNIQSGVASNSQSKQDDIFKAAEEPIRQGPSEHTAHKTCQHWGIRGNEAYKIGDLSKAEDFYTKGINTVPDTNISGCCIEPLLLCYSNRAATRMSLGRMRDAIGDCTIASSLDPSYLKAKLRAANCYLVLGEVQDALQHYNTCVESFKNVCLDRRITVEAADGLLKAQKVAEYMHQSAELLQQKTCEAATSALGNIDEALSISRFSEILLEMKGEALCLLRMYDDVIQLCERTLEIANKNFPDDAANSESCKSKYCKKLWRWRLMSKAHYHLGRLEVALDLVEKQEKLLSKTDKSGLRTLDSSVPLAVTIRELLQRKKAGNDAFQSGRHGEAIEHYTAAISMVSDSRSFAAICFCNRAAGHQALGQIADAIADSSLAIALDGDYAKAVSRRATLHEMIRDYKQAVNDLQNLITLLENQSKGKAKQSDKQDGPSGSSMKELKQARRRLSSIQEKSKKEIPLDLYLILGIKASDTESEIKKSYRKAALRHHPDKAGQFLARNDSGDDRILWSEISEKVYKDADRLFKMIGEAYAVLSDPDKRSKYDYEEEIRNACRDSYASSNHGRQSDAYSSPFERGGWSGRQYDSYSSPFERSSNRRYWQESWRSHEKYHTRW